VICRDLGDDVSKWSRVDVAVDVAPPNDHAPRFERLRYDCHVTENAADDVIATVKAVDVDSGPSGQVKQRCKTTLFILVTFLQCFDAVGWASSL